MPQSLAPSKTLLEAALQALQQVVTDASATIMGTFREDSAERLQLVLEHLQALKLADHEPSHTAQVADLIDAYADPKLHPDIERIARMMTSRAYKQGRCHATQEKISSWTGIPKATLQLRLNEMERLELIQVQRRPGTSSITLFADGTLDALRLKKINKIKTRERINPRLKRTFTDPNAANTHGSSDFTPVLADSWPKNTTCSNTQIASQSVVKNQTVPLVFLSNHSSSSRARVEKTPGNRNEVIFEEKKSTEKNTEKPVVQSLTGKYTTFQTVKEKERTPIAKGIPSHSTTQQNATKLLAAQGVTPARAVAFARLYDHERIEQNIRLGLHLDKKNPPAYLLRLIQDDAAARRISPTSEAARIREQERPTVYRSRSEALTIQPPPQVTSSLPKTPEKALPKASEPPNPIEEYLTSLVPQDCARYEQRAREKVLRANAWLGENPSSSNPMVQILIRKQLEQMRASAQLAREERLQAQHVVVSPPANGEQGQGVIGSQLPEELRGNDVLPTPREACAVAVGGFPVHAPALAVADARNLDLPQQFDEPRNRGVVFGPKTEHLPEVLQHGFRNVPITDSSIKRANRLRGNDPHAPGFPSLVPKRQVGEGVFSRADDFLVFVAQKEQRPLLVPCAFRAPSLHDVEKAQLHERISHLCSQAIARQGQLDQIHRAIENGLHRNPIGLAKRVGKIGVGEGREHLSHLGVHVGANALFEVPEDRIVIGLVGGQQTGIPLVPSGLQTRKGSRRLNVPLRARCGVEEIAVQPIQAVAVGKKREHA